jgi:ATP-dependent DNA helicase RecG
MSRTKPPRWLTAGESEHLEFIRRPDRKSHVEEAACAFLNSDGGRIVVGVGDEGELVGVERAEEAARALQQRLAEAISPPVPLSATVEALAGHNLLLIEVPRGVEKPYVCQGRILVREGTQVRAATAFDLSSLIEKGARGEHRWERRPALGLDLDDLDLALVDETAARIRQTRGYPLRASDPRGILGRLGLIHSGQFTNAAAVLFAKNPAPMFPQTRARAARFRDTAGSELADSKIFEGNLFALLEQLDSFLKAHVPVASQLRTGKLIRDDLPVYPWPAVREALVNALVHRDYRTFDGGMSLAVHDDRIEVWNSGELPEGMTIAELHRSHPSRPRNPDIAQVCFLAGLMERWGTGTQRIITACREANLPEPEWAPSGGGILLTLRARASTADRAAPGFELNLRQLEIVSKLRPGARLRIHDYLRLAKPPVKERQARIDLTMLTEAGFLQRLGAGPATAYIRTSKQVAGFPGESPHESTR